jgi:cytochrome c oxidase cbb3-type subunit I/II
MAAAEQAGRGLRVALGSNRALEPRVEGSLVAAHAFAAFGTLLAAVVFGIVVSLQFVFPDLSGGFLPAGWGRLRYAHTRGIMLGWLGNAFFAFLYHAVPVLTGRPVTSVTLGRWLFGLWNFAVVVPGFVLVLAGVSQPLEWAEFPLVVDAFAIVGLVLAAVQFLPPFFRQGLDTLYVSSWYIIGSLVFTLLAFPMGNLVPEFVPGAAGAAFSGLWIHDAVGLFVTPLALAILYFVIPAATGRPVFSHFLSMLGFWGLFFLYPLNGTHHYVFSAIPMEAQMGAIVASALLGVIVVIVVANLLLSLRGAGIFPRDPGLRFVAMSTIFYVIVSVQGSLQAQMSLNQAVHFTDWVIGHSHLAMLGFATFAALGGVVHAWQRLPQAHYNERVVGWGYWLLVVGISVMVVDLTIAGIVEARLWLDGAPWLESVRAATPYWFVRSAAAVPIAAGFLAVLVGLTTGPRGAGAAAIGAARAAAADAQVAPVLAPSGTRFARGLGMAYVVAGVAGLAFFGFSVMLLGVWPERVLAAQTAATAPANALGLTVAEERGRAIYAREGCAYCHTQQIRYTAADIARFGAPTLAWETRFDRPHLWGTRRIGPDLARTNGTRTVNWHYVHLYAPRAVVPWSIMPSYAALFDGSPERPRQEAQDLVAYLESLGRARELAWPDGDAAARAAVAHDHYAEIAFTAKELNAHPGRPRLRGDAPALPRVAAGARGRAVWLEQCAGCHGADGRGDGPAAAWLHPAPPNLTLREFGDAYLADALWNGVAGTSMPAWRDQSLEDLAALAAFVRTFASVAEESPPAGALEVGARVYAAHCAECHGPSGAGDGFAAKELPVAPTDFRNRRASFAENVRVLTAGIEGTSMAPWTGRLSGEELVAVAHYVRSLWEGEAP